VVSAIAKLKPLTARGGLPNRPPETTARNPLEAIMFRAFPQEED